MARFFDSPRRNILAVLFLLVVVPAGATPVRAQDALKALENFNFAKHALEPAHLASLDEFGLALLRGVVFGRHGRIFKDTGIRLYLQDRPWYKPDPQFQNSVLNDIERRNLDLIRLAEAKLHAYVQPGDMRYWQTRLIPKDKLGEHSAGEWRILRAEIEAIHGRRFDDQPWMQEYFTERYWYAPRDAYDPKQLTDIERRNLAAIDAAQKKQRQVGVSPGDMELFLNTPVTEDLLRGLGLYELRLLRNEVYARRGRVFQTIWLAQYFYSQPWYEPNDDFADAKLTGIERQNVETIVKYENRLKEELSIKTVPQKLLDGLFLEDARKLRNEILARHGKVFKDKWLQAYFASFAWYKPDPKFKESALNAVERRNVAAILAYEKKATSVLDAIEG